MEHDAIVESLLQLIGSKKTNGKVYGGKTKSMYLDNDKVEISDSQANIIDKTQDGSLHLDYDISISWSRAEEEMKRVKFSNPDGFVIGYNTLQGKLNLMKNTKLSLIKQQEIIDTGLCGVCTLLVYGDIEYYLFIKNGIKYKSQKIDKEQAIHLLNEMDEIDAIDNNLNPKESEWVNKLLLLQPILDTL